MFSLEYNYYSNYGFLMPHGSVKSLILTFCFILVVSRSGAQRLQMIPSVEEQVVEANTTLTLTCVYNYNDGLENSSISWMLPAYLQNFPEKSEANSRLQITYHGNSTHLVTIMTLQEIGPKDSGKYGCIGEDRIDQHVYVYSEGIFIFMDNGENVKDFYSSKQGDTLHIPCKPTHPNVKVSLNLVRQWASKEWADDISKDLLSVPDSNWSFNSDIGLILRNTKISDSGYYQCVGTMNDVSNYENFRIIVKGMELTRIGDADDPLEGSNVTLICLIHTDGEINNEMRKGFPSPPEWYYRINDTGPMQVINKTNPPKGIQTKKEYEVKLMRHLHGFYESRLDLIDVNILSPYTNFECKSSIQKRITESKTISFGIKVRLEEGRSKNLTCIIASKDIQIKWLKDDKPYTGEIYSTANISILPLKGIKNEIGVYACQWNNSLGQVGFRNFTLFLSDETSSEMETYYTTIITFAVILAVLLALGIGISVKLYFDLKKQVFPGAKKLLEGNVKEINPQFSIEEQTELLPYDKAWEFPRCRLTLGVQLGSGCFGRVVKGEAIGIKGSRETVRTVAVKMVRSQTNVAAMESLVSELKILIHLGSHLNVVNLLGACTKKITKGELLIIVEYCRFGNLQTYLMKHRNSFINLLDEFGNMKPDSETEDLQAPILPDIFSFDRNSIADENPAQSPFYSTTDTEAPEWWNYGHQEEQATATNKAISTRDLISWSFQIARGMDYLASKKVLHGDLAARNVLLADEGVVKVADFGMAKKMYYEGNYERAEGLMPVKWMAIESLTARIFSSQSDVWSFGVLLWELFTLGEVPYPGMDVGHLLIKEIKSGYRMEKPDNAPNFFGVIMANCWKTEPNERPTFRQLEEMINSHMESSVSCHYLNLSLPYGKFNEEDTATPTDVFGITKLLKGSTHSLAKDTK
ncbi:vascular endothelial growth factor receptor 1-like [Daphnia carinata]|uniref:vascular endothelial growth factor receptor 1-like n=1 Tax=Daphnia carinata TaxID=120202 RepID=UPI00286942D3|nr:vascular endothelial growth factor receptor 1-like [Daphnia carinata]